MNQRIRTIKPELFRHEGLFDLEAETKLPIRVAWMGLFTCADREGRFPWRPRVLKTMILPYDDVDFARLLEVLASHGFIVRYQVEGELYGCIPTFKKHQRFSGNEAQSESQLPAPPCGSTRELPGNDFGSKSDTPEKAMVFQEGKGKEGKGTEGNGKEECAAASAAPPASIIALPLNSGEYQVKSADLEQWRQLYPAIDVMQELRKMRAWLDANPRNRKTSSGVKRFIVGWLNHEQDSARAQSVKSSKPQQRIENTARTGVSVLLARAARQQTVQENSFVAPAASKIDRGVFSPSSADSDGAQGNKRFTQPL